MLTKVMTFALEGVEPVPVSVEVDIRPGLPTFQIVGLGDTAVRESRERVRGAIQNSGFEFPMKRIVANLAPASLRKSGPSFDAALAVGILAASEQIPLLSIDGTGIFGELSLSGELKSCAGALPATEGARTLGLSRIFLPEPACAEASLIRGISIGAVRDLRELHSTLIGERPLREVEPQPEIVQGSSAPDLSDVVGQPGAVEALVVAAAGGHNLLLEGPPGTGKTMLARRLPALLPPLDEDELIEVARIQSATGIGLNTGSGFCRPFRAPHHSVSAAGLLGGGSVPVPGEVTLAHRGVLFLDEFPEFRRDALESLRQPLEEGEVSIVRRAGRLKFPSRFQLIAAANPCPCGVGEESNGCQCPPLSLERYRSRMSGPVLDRIDLSVFVGRPAISDFARAGGGHPSSTTSKEASARVQSARQAQHARLGPGRLNRDMSSEELTGGGALETAAERVLAEAYERHRLSPRGRVRVLRVARTVADLEGEDTISQDSVLAALAFRMRGPKR